MKIIIIRHGDPIYGPEESLTEQGFKEVKALGEMYKNIEFSEAYVSNLVRAKLTAKAVLEQTGREAIECPWLAEFIRFIKLPKAKEKSITWDFLPKFFEKKKKLYDFDKCFSYPFFKKSHIKQEYLDVINKFEEVLNKHGYYKKGKLFHTEKGNNDVLVFFCHMGTMSLLMSHLLNIPCVVIAQKFACPTTGVTTLYTEEREKGFVQFRLQSYGDISHLRAAGLEPSFSARFCETFESPDRHN